MDTSPLESVIALLGSQTALANLVGVTPQAISVKLKSGSKIAAEWCLPIEEATEGKITRHQLRPDLYPPLEQESAA